MIVVKFTKFSIGIRSIKVVLPILGSKNEFLNFLRSINLSKLVFGSQAIEFGLFAKYFTNKLLAQIQFLVVQS